MAILNARKMAKLKRDPKLFFKDAIRNRIHTVQKIASAFAPKKFKGYQKYIIISAVYNVEKYLKAYFNSFIHQRLDFENNILLILVDDGSTDTSASIIKKYQSKYPKNIIYLHKENGGQASARNLGLEYLKEYLNLETKPSENSNLETNLSSNLETKPNLNLETNENLNLKTNQNSQTNSNLNLSQNLESNANLSLNLETKQNLQTNENLQANPQTKPQTDEIFNTNLKTPANEFLNANLSDFWVNFTDPDDFLDRSCLYEVDEFLRQNQSGVSVLGLNNQLYFEKTKHTTNHPLHHYKFTSKINKIFINELTYEISTATCNVFKLENIINLNIRFNELMGHSEDVDFTLNFTNSCKPYELFVFLDNAKYYIRKRANNSSTMNNFLKDKRTFIQTPYFLLQRIKKDPCFYAQTTIFASFLNTFNQILGKQKISILNKEEQDEFLRICDEVFSYIDERVVMDFKGFGNDIFKKIGILNCFKNEVLTTSNVVFIENIDPYKQQILLNYFTHDPNACESIRINNEELYPDYEKIVRHRIFDRTFCYEKRLWVHIPDDKNGFLEAFLDGKRAFIKEYGKDRIHTKELRLEFRNCARENFWLFIDRDIEADDNAERFYRYVKQNYPEKDISFALDPKCPDWQRLEQEGFKLVKVYSKEFYRLAKKCRNFISSHTPIGFGVRLESGQRFIFLGHGIDNVDLSTYVNRLNVSLRTSTLKRELEFISQDFSPYKLTKKEVALTGNARHDNLLKNNKTNNKQIIIMPTWREYLIKEREGDFNRKVNDDFLESEYYKAWFSFLNNAKLKKLSQNYGIKIVFLPHFNMKNMLKVCTFPDFLEVSYRKGAEPFANFLTNSDLMITDYSSVGFEMAYLGKTVLYYQFDKEEFFANHTYQQGFFSYEEDGFGPVCYTEKALLQELELAFKNNCEPKEPYKSRIENTFEFRDGKCCERIYNTLLELDEPYKQLWDLKQVEQKAKNALERGIYREARERFCFILENFKDYENLEIKENLYNFLFSSRLALKSEEALNFVEEKNYQAFFNEDLKLCFEYIKNLIQAQKIKQALEKLEKLEIPRENELEFAYLKLKIYSFFADKKAFTKIYNELKDNYKISKENLGLDLFLFQQELMKEFSKPTGGGINEVLFEKFDLFYRKIRKNLRKIKIQG